MKASIIAKQLKHTSIGAKKIRRHDFYICKYIAPENLFLFTRRVETLKEFMCKKAVVAPALFLKQPCWVKQTSRKNY